MKKMEIWEEINEAERANLLFNLKDRWDCEKKYEHTVSKVYPRRG